MGKFACIRHEKDTPFCFIENNCLDSDLLNCPTVMDINELLQVAEHAWSPKNYHKDDPDHLDYYRYSCIMRFICAANNTEGYEKIKEMIAKENSMGCGAKMLVFQLDKTRKKHPFDFEKVFPKTHAMLSNGKFRWFLYKKDILRVLVGRGAGYSHRDYERRQVLKTWKYKFESFHELLCAVEASWVYKGKELKADDVLVDFDADLEPSQPGPKEPTCYGNKDDCVQISASDKPEKAVTALAITEEDGKSILYSGHHDGTLCKYCLDDNQHLWTKQMYPNVVNDFTESHEMWGHFHLDKTPGVAGIVIRPNGKSQKTHLIYTWTHIYPGFPDVEFKDREPSRVKCWNSDGFLKREYICDVGDDEEGNRAHPTISTVVFCELYREDLERWVDSMIVGLHCVATSIDWKNNYSDFDLETAQECGEGNILPFFEHSRGEPMETWREDIGLVRALAVCGRKKTVLSYGVHLGHGFPLAIVLWSCEEPGVPLCRFNCEQCRINGVAGLSVHNSDVILADCYADRIVAISVEEYGLYPKINVEGYGKIGNRYYIDEGFHGRMAMSGPFAAMANEMQPTVWIFETAKCASNSALDHKDGKMRAFYMKDTSYDENDRHRFSGREIAIGSVRFPEFGGNPPSMKKDENPSCMIGSESKPDDFGDGGVIALAIRGKWLVAGFSNGTLSRVELPKDFEIGMETDLSCNHQASCSSLPSDMWYAPILDFEM
mmetsp:Transcript_14353/g.26944  ORF Transcript_14353/g.26944 Transcript_14353/m.26944 type:complete len:718 (-) Transcript_14353:1861-4014(-)